MLVLTSCSRIEEYHQSRVIPYKGWEIYNIVNFSDSLPENNTCNYSFDIQIRHRNDYQYGNIWLYIRTETSDNIVRFDTINWKLADYTGHWFGKGWGSLYNIEYKMPDLNFSKKEGKKWFKIDVQHGLRDNYLKGIESIGIKLSPLSSVSIQPQENK
jgi:gliding motility-associated lipoprotein GldH